MTNLFDLLSRGYFPRELPPPFETTRFAEVVRDNLSSLPESFTNKKQGKMARHNLARAGTLRRRLGIPNPILHFNLCQEIEQHWTTVEGHTQQSNLSYSTPVIGKSAGRAVIPKHSQSDLLQKRAHVRGTARFILKTDISRFYPSIYTHSIPWAIHGKQYAKSNRNTSDCGNAFDMWMRNAQDGQTIGIPIGPDSSLIIAETILCAVDKTLLSRLSRSRGFRYVDDFEFGFNTHSEAESGISILQEALAEYELELNPGKTKIIQLPLPLEDSWVAELRSFNFRTKQSSQLTDLLHFFDKAFELMRLNPQKHVLRYAISRLNSEEVNTNNWTVFQNLLMQCINVEPQTFTPVLSHLLNYSNNDYSLDLSSIEQVMNDQICYHSPLNHGSEVSWALWTLMVFNIQITSEAASALSKLEDSVVALLALDAFQRGLVKNGLDLSIWQTYMDQEGLYSDQWLLSYEANIKGWLSSNGITDHVHADPNFNFLKSKDVQFYNLNKVGKVMRPTGVAPSEGFAPLFSLG